MSDHIEREEDYTADLLSLMDEDGVEHNFEVADTLELDGESYVALIPVIDDPAGVLDGSDELVILHIADDGEEEYFETVEDEELFERVSAMFVERLDDEYDFEDDEDGSDD